ncbi:MAG: hypothetical protein RL160_549 [Bacteroidota bacterium]|jgi:hypothetical protein
MKKAYFTLAAIAVFAFAACNGKSGEANADSTKKDSAAAPAAAAAPAQEDTTKKDSTAAPAAAPAATPAH